MSVHGIDVCASGDATERDFVVLVGGTSGYIIDETQGSDLKYALNVFVVSGSVIGGGGAGGWGGTGPDGSPPPWAALRLRDAVAMSARRPFVRASSSL